MQHAIVGRISEEEYLEGEKIARVKHEYVAGEVFAMAVKKLLEKEKTGELLAALNEAYSEGESSEEVQVREKSKRYYQRRIIKEE